MDLLKLLNPQEIVAQMLCFLAVFFLLRHFLWGRLLNVIDERKARIGAEFRKAEEIRSDMEKLKSEYDAKLSSAEKEAHKRVQEAIEDSKKIAEGIKKDARIEGLRILEQARGDIKYELSKAKDELKEKVIDLTIEATAAVIQEKITQEQDRKIIENFLDKVDTIE
ncbi:MAG TPA: F0F1 ATP synthase subunit B [Candidatus Omnitrophota bacterium]|nr:F0F1 ATP synthase subunit B [Candidatus Omnitrophota bacterium]HPT07302.1 F0F1 ATP synthase subunit B [Candidatus Omnitrophota bacterium]